LGDKIIVAWKQSDGTNQQIFNSQFLFGTWFNPTDLSDNLSPDGTDATAPQEGMDSAGNTIIVWSQGDGTNQQIFMANYDILVFTWSPPVDLTDNISPDGTDATAPHVAMNASGMKTLAWVQSDGTNQQIFKSEFHNGISCGSGPVALSTMTWLHPTGLSDNISPDGADAATPHAAQEDSGDAIIVWAQNDGTHTQIYKSEFRCAVWTHPSDLTDKVSFDGQSAQTPKAAMSNNGDAVLVWVQSDGGLPNLYLSEYRLGSWTNPADLTDHINPSPACNDGLDNDSDGGIDYTADFGCDGPGDTSELSAAFLCDNGVDDDLDTWTDTEDPGCLLPTNQREDPQCQDGVNNDGDALIDYDGGQSIWGACSGGVCPPGVSDPDEDGIADPDPQCVGKPWRNNERRRRCGLGFELALVLAPLMALRRRRLR
jgi:hypothetical protein